jgi:hypothetical protein
MTYRTYCSSLQALTLMVILTGMRLIFDNKEVDWDVENYEVGGPYAVSYVPFNIYI